MNVVWMTPFFRDSAVGELAGRVAVEMASAGHNVVVVGCGQEPYIDTPLRFVAAGENGQVDPDFLNQFDAVVFNVSNHGSSFPIFWAMERTPGIVVLCDRVYVHGLDAYTQRIGAPARLEAMASRYYGNAGVEFVRRFRAGAASPEDFERFPFVEPLLELAQGALVHSMEYRDLVASRWSGRVGRLTGFTVPPRPPTAAVPREALNVAPGDFLLAFVGYITPYRSIDVVLDVLRDRPDLASRTKFAIVGRIEDQVYAQALQDRAAAYGLASIMRWGLNSSDDVKHAVLTHADAAFNCRSLNSEGSSASLLEEMSYGIPTIVNANGFARDIPADAVRFVERATMRTDVERAIDALIADPQRRRDIGARAKAWVAGNSSTASYASEIVRMAEETARLRPVNAVRGRFDALLSDMGITESGTYGTALHRTVRELLEQPADRAQEPPAVASGVEVLFVRGCPRSGTTLTADLLNEVPEIGLLVEYPFGMLVRHLLPILWFEDNVNGEIARANETGRKLKEQGTPVRRDTFFVPLENKQHVRFAARFPTRARFPAIVANVVETSLQKPGLKILGSKTPGRWDPAELDLVKQVFGQPKYVYVMRNPLETVNSIVNRRNFARAGNDYWPYETVEQAIVAYREAVCQLLSCMASEPAHTYAIGYEDLLTSPDDALASLSRFLGVEVTDRSRLIKGSTHGKTVLTAEELDAVRAAFGSAIDDWPRKRTSGLATDLAGQFDDCVARLEVGVERRFDRRDADRSMLGPSWSLSDESGVWTETAVADVFFRAPESGSYAMTVELAGYVPPGAPPMKVTVGFEGGPQFAGTLTDLRIARIRIGPMPFARDRAYRLVFRVEAPRSPASLGQNADARTLGICLRALGLDVAEMDARI